ncbi:MAG: antibiotic biosynthesis monooxygenase [Henriciella sp.]
MILRVFEVQSKLGAAPTLIEKFATSSIEVVKDAPGNRGYFFGREIADDEGRVMFTSIWESLEAIKTRFGETWTEAFLPDGYEDLIQSCHVRHIDISDGWRFEDATAKD